MKTFAMTVVLAALAVLALAYLGLPEALGAHPFWAVRVAYLGLGPGLAAIWLMRALGLSALARVVIAAGLLVVAFAVARTGGLRFAASYAEDAAAGAMWFWGWIGTAAAATLLIQVQLSGLGPVALARRH